jgi:hypothetical protein
MYRTRHTAGAVGIVVLSLLALAGCRNVISLEELEVNTYPADRNQVIPKGEKLWVEFSIDPKRETAERNLTVDSMLATVEGDRRWSGNRLTFHPVPDLPSGVRHVLRYSGTVEAEDGRVFSANVEVPFYVDSTGGPPALLSASPADGADAAVDTPLVLAFSQGMDARSFDEEFSLSPATAFDTSWNVGGDTVTITPEDRWETLTLYSWSVTEETTGSQGVPLQQPYSGSFVVQLDATAPQLVAFGPAELSGDTYLDRPSFQQLEAVKLKFSEDVTLESLQEAFSISPSVDGNLQRVLDEGDGVVFLFLPEEPYVMNQSYFVRLSTDLRDLSGNAMLTEEVRTFTPTITAQQVEQVVSTWSGGTQTVTVFGDPTPVLIGFNVTGDDFTNTLQISFSQSYDEPYRTKIAKGVSVRAFFPGPSILSDPSLERISWNAASNILTLYLLGFKKPVAPEQYLYKLTIPAGLEASGNQDGSFLEEEVWVIFEAEAQ